MHCCPPEKSEIEDPGPCGPCSYNATCLLSISVPWCYWF